MSTFDGWVKEFPRIRIDYFRSDSSRPQPLACFLSHVHSDHTLGLETHKMPFVYCSAATRSLLLRMEKYPHRINFSRGILEARKQRYEHLASVLRPLPMETPTTLELTPKETIQVTLFDANHCPGAVMFLIQGDCRAVLYTGDIRAEPWWVNSIVQNPNLIPFVMGVKRLDCLYLDTTFASHQDKYRTFQTKAQGLEELITKVSEYPSDTLFYFRAWTLGYEQVWTTLSNLLDSFVHVDNYQLRLFSSIAEEPRAGFTTFEVTQLIGFDFGHARHPGCLSNDTNSRIHSCEPGSPCHTSLKEKNVVWITPIISRLEDGTELQEIGAGGGGGDLYQTPEIDISSAFTMEALESICEDMFEDATIRARIYEVFRAAKTSCSERVSLEGLDVDGDVELSLKQFAKLVSKFEGWKGQQMVTQDRGQQAKQQDVIHFPYSRHSSYGELRHLVKSLHPKEVHACTVDLPSWSEEAGMQFLFGDLCSGQVIHQDAEVRAQKVTFDDVQRLKDLKRKRDASPSPESTQMPDPSFRSARSFPTDQVSATVRVVESDSLESHLPQKELNAPSRPLRESPEAVKLEVAFIRSEFRAMNGSPDLIRYKDPVDSEPRGGQLDSQVSLATSEFDSQQGIAEDGSLNQQRVMARQEAYRAAQLSLHRGDSSNWDDLGLRTIKKPEDDVEIEL
jgi:DNA cross-link repair 1C protein